MHQPSKPRSVIDRKAVVAHLTDVVGDLPKTKWRQAVLGLLKQALADGRLEIRRRFESNEARGMEVVVDNRYLIDQIIRIIHDFAVEYVLPKGVRTSGEQLGVVAVGGYGRGELWPQSDIDLLFLLPYKQTPYSEQVVEYILYMLWDLGLKVGHATRSVEDCMRHAKADMTIRTAMLDARWLWGDKTLFEQLETRYRAELASVSGEEFVEAKLNERNDRHEKMGDTRYVLEPNVKDGKGGLRDMHTLSWIAKYLYGSDEMGDLVKRGILTTDAAARFAKARAFLTTVRCHLHLITGREEDRLTFDVQPEISQRMGYTDRSGAKGVERFMKHYFLVAKDVGDLTRIFCSVLEEQHKRKPKFDFVSFFKRGVEGFKVDGNRLNVASEDAFDRDPLLILRLFRAAQLHGMEIHPHALRLITQKPSLVSGLREDPAANALFLDILTSDKEPDIALRRLNESGVFGRFIPDFGRVVAQMQYDMYHVYTVDEHTIRAIGILDDIASDRLEKEYPAAGDAFRQIESKRALYVATLLHDIAKGRSGDHSEVGAKIAKKIGPRLGLTDEETDTVSWLVLSHLNMSRTAFKRDVDDPKTIHDFSMMVQSPERLRLLFLLTIADIKAVGPTVWNAWKAGLLRELYYRTSDVLSGGFAVEGRSKRVEMAKEALRKCLPDWPSEDIDAHIVRGYPSYWLSFGVETHIRHARMVREAERNDAPLTVEHRIDREHAVTEITIYADDHPGLFARISGAMAMCGASIVDAKIITLANGKALDTFWVQDAEGGAFERPDRLAKLAATIEKSLSGKVHPAKELAAKRSNLPSRASVFKVPPRVLIDNKASATHTLIEINGRDRPGLLYNVTQAITKLGLQISSAHISTYGERVVDVFYVKDIFGVKVEHEGKLKQIRENLLAAIAEPVAG
jgi:[protein-PII] uridylyltransferase